MKPFGTKTMIRVLLFATVIQFAACKKKESPVVETPITTTTVEAPARVEADPVVISADDTLTTNVKDAVKDFPGVTATVKDGEVTLEGEVTRDRLPKLMQGLHSLQPKKINNNLVVKK